MNSSKRALKLVMRSRSSSNPKLMLGSWSAIEMASAVYESGRETAPEKEAPKRARLGVSATEAIAYTVDLFAN